LYTYVYNNPLRFTDPTGNSPYDYSGLGCGFYPAVCETNQKIEEGVREITLNGLETGYYIADQASDAYPPAAVTFGTVKIVGKSIVKLVKKLGTVFVKESPDLFKGQKYTGIRNAASDFTKGNGKSTLTKHFNDHKNDFGFKTETEYLYGARNFLEKSPTSTTKSFVSKEGTYFRYDTATNEFGIMNQYGGVSTYFKPTDRLKYWEEQIKLYAPK